MAGDELDKEAEKVYKRECSNCNNIIEIKHERYKFYRPNLIFCSFKCYEDFMKRDLKLRKELEIEPLKEEKRGSDTK